MVKVQSRCPGIPVVNRQVPYPPGGPGPARVKVNPGGSGPRGAWLRGSGRAQACPSARPRLSVTVRHHDVLGFAALAAARSRASHGSTGPSPGSSPGRPARPSRVASGTVRWLRPANPAGTPPPEPGPVPGAWYGPAG
ncbi:MAG TPA: hypothetical protein VFW50_46185 [Streptosporangiaceae bacterium]|nr:hypothetical protein [Streptosporangiaceae bacterium]